ncbi:MAG: T9SS type A sorting domain-containing protein [Bacteroidetes bacterium]|nr:T9SS type A sorting domain-containing protein [Bacteroidota bacterium]
MKQVFPLLLLLAHGHAYAQYASDQDSGHYIVRMERQAHRSMARSASPMRGYDLVYLRCAWDLDPAVREVNGSITSYFLATQDLDELVFDLSDTLTVDAATYHGSDIPSILEDDVLTIPLPTTVPEGQLDSITVTYHGVPVPFAHGGLTTGTHNGVPVLWTLSEPYSSKKWWPCKQDLNDKIDSLDAYVTVPAGNKAAGNGLLFGITTEGDDVTYHWKHRYPIDYYLIATAISNYVVDEQSITIDGQTITMVSYVFPEGLSAGSAAATMTLDQLAFFSGLFGPYPFAREKYGHAQVSFGGGMENQTMSSVASFNPDLCAHELAHHWFGNKVTCGSWQDIWLNEGSATYLTGLWKEHAASPTAWRNWKLGLINSITSQPDGSVFCADTSNGFDGRLHYDKGAMVLHMLRWICGDDAFFQGLRGYLDDPALAYNTARTSDLQAHLEQASGLDLDHFFADWFTGEGYPSYTLPWTQRPDGTVDLTLYQSTSDPSVDFFELPVPVRFSNAENDTLIVFEHTMDAQVFSFASPFQVDEVEIDPDLWLISKNNNVTTTAVTDLAAAADRLVLYPNPVEATLAWRIASMRPTSLRVLDLLGRPVLASPSPAAQLDVHALPPGGYLLELGDGRTTVRTRFVKR